MDLTSPQKKLLKEANCPSCGDSNAYHNPFKRPEEAWDCASSSCANYKGKHQAVGAGLGITPKLLFMAIDPQPRLPFTEMQSITVPEAVKAATRSIGSNGIEIYVKYDDDDTPDVGYVFANGKYVGEGLGSDRTEQFTKIADKMRGKPVSAQFWGQLFDKILSTPL